MYASLILYDVDITRSEIDIAQAYRSVTLTLIVKSFDAGPADGSAHKVA